MTVKLEDIKLRDDLTETEKMLLAALEESRNTIEEWQIALDLSIEETKRWSTLANSAMADNERLRRLLEERGVSDPEEGETQP
jgi:hypothetical protein